MVDATLVRHHLDAYDAVITSQAPADRQPTEQTLAGLRFVRNQIGDEADLAEFVAPGQTDPDPGNGHITGWTWTPVPEPKLTALAPRGQAWEMARYQAYQAQLAGHHRRNLHPGRYVPPAHRRRRARTHKRLTRTTHIENSGPRANGSRRPVLAPRFRAEPVAPGSSAPP